ncbi:MAG: hypothetical protein ABI759_30410 [Candidatus Solibacter sp.]
MLALNVVTVDPAATVTVAGTVSSALLLDTVMLAPPAGAALLNVTVHVLEAFGPKLPGAHTSELTTTGATRLTLALAELPLYVAVMVADWSEEIVPAVALKVVLVAFNGIVTVAGTTRPAAFELNPTTAGPPVAGALSFTVQFVVPPDDRDPGAQLKVVTVTGARTRMLPPVAETAMESPVADAPMEPLTPMSTELAPSASATVTTATLPSGMAPALTP